MTDEEYKEKQRYIWDNYVPPRGQSEYVQGELLGEDNKPPYSMIKLLLAHGANKQDESVLYHVKAHDIEEVMAFFEGCW